MIKLYSYFAFFTFGFFVMILPSALPVAMKEFGMSYLQSGYLMIFGTLGYILGSLICALFAHLMGLKRIAILGAMISALGLIYFALSKDFLDISISNFSTNVGMGFIETGVGALIGASIKENLSGTLNRVNAIFALGAVISPFVVSTFIGFNWNWQIVYIFSAIIAFAALIFAFKMREVGMIRTEEKIKRSYNFSPLFIIIYLMIAIYVGYEAAYSSWITTFLTNFRGIAVAVAAASSSAFWVGMFVGRFSASFIKVKAESWLLFIVSASLISVILSIFMFNFYSIIIFVFLSGLFFASTYPTIQMMLIERAEKNIGNLMGVFVLFVGMGATIAQWIVSGVSSIFGIVFGFSLIPVMILADLLLSISLVRRKEL